MLPHPPDPLLDRMRAADPGAALDASAVPARERVTAARSRRAAPSTVFALEAHRLLTRARASGTHVHIARHPASGGHAAYDALSRTARIAAHVIERHELRLDPVTYAPIMYIDDEHGLDVHGK